ncbi:MAG: hypothetical protein SGARI_005703, partial [Bacillariaceae sp.]
MAAVPAAPPVRNAVRKADGGDYSSISSIGIHFLPPTHDVDGSIERGMNNFYAEQLDDISGVFCNDGGTARDAVHAHAMEFIYDQIIAKVTAIADQTDPLNVGRIGPIVKGWRLKYIFQKAPVV